MSNGGGQRQVLNITNPITGLPFSRANLYHYQVGGSSTKEPVYTDEAMTVEAAQPIVSTDGYFTFFAAEDVFIKITSGTPGDDEADFKEWDNWAIRQHHDGRWKGNFLTAYPAANDANIGQVVYKYNDNSPSANTISGMAINIDGTQFKEINGFNAAGNPLFISLLTKGPMANIEAFGADKDAADNASAIQSAITWAIANHGCVFIPPKTYDSSEIVLEDNLSIWGAGPASKIRMIAAFSAGEALLGSVNKKGITLDNFTLDGRGIADSTNLLNMSKTGGSFTNININNMRFMNHGHLAVNIQGDAGNTFTPFKLSNCEFEDNNDCIYARYARVILENNTFENNNISNTAAPIILEDCSKSIISLNRLGEWGSTVAGIKLIDVVDSTIGLNIANGTEAYGIWETGISDRNMYTGNNVAGGHTTNPLLLTGASSKKYHNIGTSDSTSAGTASTDTELWNYVKISGISDIGAPAADGTLISEIMNFPDSVLPQDDPPSKHDFINFPNWSANRNMLYPIRDLLIGVSDKKLQLGNSTVFNSVDQVGDDENFNVYPNILNSLDWESSPFWTTTLTAIVINTEVNDTVEVTGEEGLLRIEVHSNAGSQSPPYNNVQFAYTGVAKKKLIENVDLSTGGLLAYSHFLKASGSQSLTAYLTFTAGSPAYYADIKLFRLKRPIDL